MPHFQVVLGGEWEHNGGSYGLPVVADSVEEIPEGGHAPHRRYLGRPHRRRELQGFRQAHRQSRDEEHAGRSRKPPADPSDRSFFSDWGDPREYTLGDMGMGECAGEVVSASRVRSRRRRARSVRSADRVRQRPGASKRGNMAYHAMLHAAKRLVKIQKPRRFRRSGPDRLRIPHALLRHAEILGSLRRRKIRQLPVRRARQAPASLTPRTRARYLIDEAQLFIDAAHSCYNKLGAPVSRLGRRLRNGTPTRHESPARQRKTDPRKSRAKWTSSR